MIRNYRTTTHLGLRVEDEGGRGSGEDERKNREEGGGLHFSAIIAENAKLMGGSFRAALDCEKKKEKLCQKWAARQFCASASLHTFQPKHFFYLPLPIPSGICTNSELYCAFKCFSSPMLRADRDDGLASFFRCFNGK